MVVFGWLAGGYVDTQRNGSLMEKEAVGERKACLAKEKKERKDQRERGRANLHTLGAVKMSVGEIEWRREGGDTQTPLAYAAAA